VLYQHWEDRPLVIDTNINDHAPRAVALRRKIRSVIKTDDDSEATAVTRGLRSVELHSDGQLNDGWCPAHDVDEEALRKLKENGFDFSKPRVVEFTVDFMSWPPRHEAMRLLRRDYPSVAVCTSVESQSGYLEFQVYALVSYELVTNTQRHVTELMAPYLGVCSSWVVLANSPNFG
jgi:Regulator of ribonuclease activity B